MPTRSALRFVVYAVCLISGAAHVAVAAAPLTALSTVRPGQWQLREIGAPAATARSLCISDTYALMQLRHAGATCTRLVIDNGKTDATIQYSCPHAGWGRTSIHVENPDLVRIDTQGIVDNAPFEASIEGRRTGECTSAKLGAR